MATLRIAAEAARHAVEQLRHSIALLKSMRVDAAGDQAQIDGINNILTDVYTRVRNIGQFLRCTLRDRSRADNERRNCCCCDARNGAAIAALDADLSSYRCC
jgi:hypothetical protein